jgi:hypothetical protein
MLRLPDTMTSKLSGEGGSELRECFRGVVKPLVFLFVGTLHSTACSLPPVEQTGNKKERHNCAHTAW